MSTPIERIRDAYPNLSRTQRRIADYILDAGDTCCFMSLQELSEAAGVTPVTLLNFCKKIEYFSFSDFKKDLQVYIQSVISPRHVVKTDLGHYQSHSDATFLTQAMEHELSLLTDTFSCLNMDALIHAVNMLCQAREIYLVGKGLSIPVIELFLARLDFLSIPAKRIPLDNLNLLPNRLVKAGPEDVFVVFSFPNYSPVLGKIAKNVKTVLNSSLICITDKPTAPPACYADALLLCQTSSLVFYNSMTVPISVVTLLTSLMAIKTSGQRACLEEKLKQLENLRQRTVPPE